VLSSLFFHHLTRENKSRTLAEVHRVLKPGGEIHIADWGRPRSALMRTAFFLVQMLDGFATTKDNADGLIPQLLLESGFI
ncbi:class I SAM-dependent methyltransferase, partial [Effusibacillus lacus]